MRKFASKARWLAPLFASWILLFADTTVETPFAGVTHITRTEESPRKVTMHILKIDLTVPGITLKLTPQAGSRETIRQTTLEFAQKEQAQIAINGHFFRPFPSADPDAFLIGLAASEGNIYSAFEQPTQSYAIATDAPAINIDSENHASLVHRDKAFEDGVHVLEDVRLHTTLSGSAQVITNGVSTVPTYKDDEHPEGLLTPGGPGDYSNAKSWYEVPNARTIIGLADENRTLVLFTVDRAGGSQGMTVSEAAAILVSDFAVMDALNMDGGGSTTLVVEDAADMQPKIVNVSSDNPKGRSVASNLAILVGAKARPVRVD